MGVLNQLVDGGGHHVAPLLLLVPLLQQGHQVVVPVAGKFVADKVGDAKVVEAAGPHQPGQIAGGHGFLGVKGVAVEGPDRLQPHEFFQGSGGHLLLAPAVIPDNLAPGKLGDVLGPPAGKALHAKAKVVAGLSRLFLSSARQSDKTRFGARQDVPLQLGHGEQIFSAPVGSGGPEKHPAVFFRVELAAQRLLGVPVKNGTAQTGHRKPVKIVAGRGDAVVKNYLLGSEPAPNLGQAQLEVVGHARFQVEFGLLLTFVGLIFGTAGSVAAIVNPVLVVVVHKDGGRLAGKEQRQVGPVSAVVAEADLAGARVHRAAGQNGIRGEVGQPPPEAAQSQVLNDDRFLALGDVETAALHPQHAQTGVHPVQLSLFAQPHPFGGHFFFFVFFVLLLLLLLFLLRQSDKQGARAHGHVFQT